MKKMKKMKKMKNYSIIILFSLLGLAYTGCEQVLEKEYLQAISPEDVYNNINVAKAYVDNIYSKLKPGWSYGSGSLSE